MIKIPLLSSICVKEGAPDRPLISMCLSLSNSDFPHCSLVCWCVSRHVAVYLLLCLCSGSCRGFFSCEEPGFVIIFIHTPCILQHYAKPLKRDTISYPVVVRTISKL